MNQAEEDVEVAASAPAENLTRPAPAGEAR